MGNEFIVLLVVSILYISYLIYLNTQTINILNLKHLVIDSLIKKEKDLNIRKSFLNLELKYVHENIEKENKSFKITIFIFAIIEGIVYTFFPVLFFIIISIFLFMLLFSSFTMIKHFTKLQLRLNSLVE